MTLPTVFSVKLDVRYPAVLFGIVKLALAGLGLGLTRPWHAKQCLGFRFFLTLRATVGLQERLAN